MQNIFITLSEIQMLTLNEEEIEKLFQYCLGKCVIWVKQLGRDINKEKVFLVENCK